MLLKIQRKNLVKLSLEKIVQRATGQEIRLHKVGCLRLVGGPSQMFHKKQIFSSNGLSSRRVVGSKMIKKHHSF